MRIEVKHAKTEIILPKVAFVLSGGAAMGASQVGMLRALLQRGIRPDLIVGTSIGAWNGLWLAAHPELEWLDKLETVWRGVTIFEMLGTNALDLVTYRATRRPYLVSHNGMLHILNRAATLGELGAVSQIAFEQLKIPFKINATNLSTGMLDTFEHGLVQQPLLASSSIPGMFPPVTMNGMQYVDGGLLDNSGITAAVQAGATRIYMLSVMTGGIETHPVASMGEMLVRSFHIIAANHVRYAMQRYAGQVEFILIEDTVSAHSTGLDFRHTPELLASGYTLAQQALNRFDEDQQQRRIAAAEALQRLRETQGFAGWLRQPVPQAALRTFARVDLSWQKTLLEVNRLSQRLHLPAHPLRLRDRAGAPPQ